MEENNNSYKKVDNFYRGNSSNSSFSKSVFLPFVSGVLGATLIIGTCFGVPSIKEKLLGTSTQTTTKPASTVSSSNNDNSGLVSLANYSDTSSGVASKVLPSIVGIEVKYSVNSFFNTQSTATASGSGIIISEDGYILTNNHIVNSGSSTYYQVSEATGVKVCLYGDETSYDATIVGTDEVTDLAVIKIDKTGLTPAEIGNSDNVKIGEFSMAIGNPLGMQSSITCGVISALNRKITDSDGKQYTLIQTDAAINSGNSGGALVNSLGQVIGINTLKLAGNGIEGMGFAIPINSTIDIYEQLIQYNKVKRPYIGITGISVDEKTSKAYNIPMGVYVKSVEDFSSAQKAGLKNGDVIIEIDDEKISSMDELNNIKNNHNIGDTLTLKINRDGNEKTLDLVLGEQP